MIWCIFVVEVLGWEPELRLCTYKVEFGSLMWKIHETLILTHNTHFQTASVHPWLVDGQGENLDLVDDFQDQEQVEVDQMMSNSNWSWWPHFLQVQKLFEQVFYNLTTNSNLVNKSALGRDINCQLGHNP